MRSSRRPHPSTAVRSRSVRALVVLLAVGLFAIWPVSVVAAHANLVAASPAVGQPAGGTIDRVQMIFDEPITELEASIEAPDGTIVAASLESVSRQQHDLVFEPLELEGIYRVRYAFVSLDTDRVELGHAFEFDRSAPAPLPISGPILVERTDTRWQWVVVSVVAVAVVGLGVRLQRRRRALARLVG